MYIIIFAKLLVAISIYSCFQVGFHVLTMGGAVAKENLPKALIPESKLEAKIVEAMQHRESEGTSLKSFNSIILKFPKIDSSLRKCKATFQQFGQCYILSYLICCCMYLVVYRSFSSLFIKNLFSKDLEQVMTTVTSGPTYK